MDSDPPVPVVSPHCVYRQYGKTLKSSLNHVPVLNRLVHHDFSDLRQQSNERKDKADTEEINWRVTHLLLVSVLYYVSKLEDISNNIISYLRVHNNIKDEFISLRVCILMVSQINVGDLYFHFSDNFANVR